MKKQLHMMARALTFCTVLSSVPVFAQMDRLMYVQVPFAFTAGQKTFDPGEYRVKASVGEATVLIQSKDYRSALFVLTDRVETRSIQEKPKLVFNRYGSQHFLAQVWPAGSAAGRQFRMTKAEQEIARTIKKQESKLLGALRVAPKDEK